MKYQILFLIILAKALLGATLEFLFILLIVRLIRP